MKDLRISSNPLRFLCALLAVGWAGTAWANPPLANPSFEIAGASGPVTVNTTTVPGGAGLSAADSWGVFHNTGVATTRTDLLPSTLPGGGARMLSVRTDGPSNGISQVTGPPGSGVTNGVATGWVYVLNGVVGMGSGNHGSTGIDAVTTTTGAWEYLQAPNGQSPFNTLIFYSQGGGADFYVELASLDEVQEVHKLTDRVEYSNRNDEQASASGGQHGADDAGQVLYTEPVDVPLDGLPMDAGDFFPAIEQNYEPDAQVDALAEGGDALFDQVVNSETPLLISVEFDSHPSGPVAVFFAHHASGAQGIEYTQAELHAEDLPGQLEDVDALEMWGETGDVFRPFDSEYFSIEGDIAGVSIYTTAPGVTSTYLTQSELTVPLLNLGWDGQAADVDVDALMVKDTGGSGVWDNGDEVLFSIAPSGGFDGGEIIHWRFAGGGAFLDHGGHKWDTAFDVGSSFETLVDNVDALEATPVPEPDAAVALLAGSLLLVAIAHRAHRRRE